MNENFPWDNDPALRRFLNPQFPGDIQVIVHEGGPRLTESLPELMWVKILEKKGVAYEGEVLNAPQNIKTIALGSKILFLGLAESEHPFRVTEKYLSERNSWNITACHKCGFSELFDAPSDLMAKIFPNVEAGDSVAMFTSFCPLCGGVQVVELKDNNNGQETYSNRKWWQFWK